jgi:heparin binding hemagglutinin HbhA
MATTTESSSPIDPTPLFAVVGVTDLAVERVRAAAATASAMQAQFEARVTAVQADVEKRVTEFDPRTLQAQVQDVPNKAAAFALTAASRAIAEAETTYEGLAARGKNLVDRVRSQAATQDFVSQANSTLSRGKAAVTVARKAADDTTSALLGTITTTKRETTKFVDETEESAEDAAKRTRTSARKTTTTARKKAAATKSAAKGVQTSAAKTATKAGAATRNAAKKVGD